MDAWWNYRSKFVTEAWWTAIWLLSIEQKLLKSGKWKKKLKFKSNFLSLSEFSSRLKSFNPLNQSLEERGSSKSLKHKKDRSIFYNFNFCTFPIGAQITSDFPSFNIELSPSFSVENELAKTAKCFLNRSFKAKRSRRVTSLTCAMFVFHESSQIHFTLLNTWKPIKRQTEKFHFLLL